MPPAIEIDRTQPLLMVVRFHSAASDQEFARYVTDYTQILLQEHRFGAVFVTAPGLPMTPPRQVRMQATFMKEHAQLIERRVVGVAFALPSPLMRGVLRGVLMLQPMPTQHTVVGTEAEGVAWVKARLWTDHVRRMKGGA
ncbi:MAG TPA: hypothetical protein VHB79_33810 [Polyangiaceae bacterium]|nr:hypothetical protein [Polyangiaceae bacterium]